MAGIKYTQNIYESVYHVYIYIYNIAAYQVSIWK